MNSPRPSAGKQHLTLRDRVALWRELLDECGRKPTRKRVHALRVVTLRIQAELEHEIADLPHASHQAQAMLRFEKLAEKLRAVLAPVREFDVWITKLQRLGVSLRKSGGYVPRTTQECISQIERLEDGLKKRRRSAAQKLAAQIAKRSSDLVAVAEEIHEDASDRWHGADSHLVESILKQFAAIVAEFPVFDKDNLHEFRKRIKKVRYLAEIHQDADPVFGRIASHVKKAQTAVGEWHDWQILSQTARQGRHTKNVEIGELLSSLAAEKFELAIATCHSAIARIAELQTESSHEINGLKRKPPEPGSPSTSSTLSKLA
jgi:CHAD domain-containing protein